MLPLPGRNKKNPEPIIFEISENGFAHVGESESSKSMSAALKTAGGSAAAPAVAVGLVVAVIDQSREPSCELVSLREKGLESVSTTELPERITATVTDCNIPNDDDSGCFRHQLLPPRPYLVLTKPLRLDIQCQRGASVKIGWEYLDD